MKTNTISLSMLLLICSTLRAQEKEYLHVDRSGFKHIDTTINNNYCVCLVEQGNKPSFIARDVIVTKKEYLSQGILGLKQEALRKYGSGCVITMKLKLGVTLLNLTQMLEKFHLKKELRFLPVFIDKQEYVHAGTLMAVPANIKYITIVTDVETNKRFISIITFKYEENDDIIHHG